MIGASAISKSVTGGFATHALGFGVNVVSTKAMGGPEMTTGRAIAEGAFWTGAEALVKGAMLYPMLAEVGKMGYTAYNEWNKYGQGKIQKNYRAGFGGNFQDTQQAYTMRQRGVEQMQQSKLNARNVLGSEARTFHQPYGG